MTRSKWATWGLISLIVGVALLVLYVLELNVNFCGLGWSIILLMVGVRLIQIGVSGERFDEDEPISVGTDGAQQARLELVHVAGRLNLGGNPAQTALIEGKFGGGIGQRARRIGDVLDVEISPERGLTRFLFPWNWVLNNWALGVSVHLPMTMRLNVIADGANMDLTAVNAPDLRLMTVFSTAQVLLPSAGHIVVKMDAILSSVVLHVPEGVAVRIEADGVLNSISINHRRFFNVGDAYESPNFKEAAQKIELQLNAVFASVMVK